MKKRLLTVLLAVCLVIALGTVTAAADDETPVARIGDETYTSLDNAMWSLDANETLVLLNDCDTSYFRLSNNSTIDLNGHNLTYTGTTTVTFNGAIGSGKEASIIDSSVSGSEIGGSLIINGERPDGTVSVFEIVNTTLNVSNIRVQSTGCVFFPKGNDAELNITNCDITTSGVFCVATNAGSQTNYGVTINILNSSLTADSDNKDDCGIMMNVSGTLNIENSTITGNRQGVFARAGDVNIVNSKIAVTGAWAEQGGNDADKYYDSDWQSGNEAPSAAIVIGNRNGTYFADADVNINDSEIVSEIDDLSAMHVDATTTAQGESEVKYASNVSITGSDTVVTGNITSNAQDSAYKSIEIAVTGGTYDINVSEYIQDGAALNWNSATGEVVADEAAIEAAAARVGSVYYDTLSNAIAAAKDGDTVTLVKNSTGNTSVALSDGRSITLDMNGFDAGFARNANIKIYHGNLNITGSGMLYEESPNYAPVMMYGSAKSVADYSVVTIGPNVTLRGWAGLFINRHGAHESQAYGIVANVYGTLKSVKDTTGAGGHALYINGTIKATEGNVPHFILDGATLITEDGNGMYLAGYAETEIKDSTITSSSEGSTGIEIRAGKLKISGDTVITGGSGEFTVTPNGNGSTTGNVALAVVQHTTKLPLEVVIEDGRFIGGAAMFEQNAQNNDAEAIKKINIEVTGGEYRGQIYSENIDSFIHSGNFSSPVNRDYLADNLTAELYSRSNPEAPYSYYPSVAAAQAAAQPGDVITDLTDIAADAEDAIVIINYGNGDVQTINSKVGATITLTAPARNGYTFGGWRYGNTVYKAGETVKVTSDMTFTAIWNAINIPDTYDIDLVVGEGGEAKTNFSNASAGTTITVTVTPDDGYELDYITVDGERISGTNFKMPDHDVTVRVYFTDGTSTLPFTDVSANQWFYEAVSYVYTNGMMEGDSATTFNPDGRMTRAMFWAVLGRIDGATITGSNWVETARSWAMAEGVSDGTNPNDYVTREMMVTMLWRYVGEPASEESLSGYSDVASVSEWAAEAMSWALETGVIEGVTATTLQPQGTATRAQCATIFMRYDMI